MTETQRLDRELAALRGLVRVVSAIAWGVALIVMIYGVPIVYRYLTHHDVPKETAWLLSLAVDGALAVGLVATPILAQHGVKSGWVGVLRWVAGFATWALNTAESWFKPGGPDASGVFSHSWGPLMMFFAVEAAAYFQRKMAEVIARKLAALDAAEAKRHSDAQERADLHNRVNALTAELADARRQIEQHTSETATAARRAESEIASIRASAEAEVDRIRAEAEAETGILRQRLEAAEATVANLRQEAEATATAHREALQKVRAEAAEKVARAKAEAGIPHLEDRRAGGGRRTSGGAAKATTGGGSRATLTDEQAVQKCIAEHPEPNYPWAQADIVKIVGCGWGRAPRLLEAIAEYHSGGASAATAEVTSATTGGGTDNASDPTTEDPIAHTG